MGGSNAINSRQMARFTFVAQTGTGVTIMPAILAREVGHDGWISLLVTGLLVIIFSALVAMLLRKYSDKTIFDINNILFGKIIGTFLNILLLIYLIVAASGAIRVFIFFIKITTLPSTPSIIMTPLILLPSFYMIWKGLKVTARFKAVTMLAYALLLIYVLIILRMIRFSFLLPVGEADFTQLLYSMRTSYFTFVGWELIAIFYPEITDKGKALKWHVRASLFATLFFLFVSIACTGIFGENFLSRQTIPLFTISRIYNAPIIERVDLYITTAWFIVLGCSSRAYMMASYYSLNKIFKLEKNWVIYSVFIIVVIGISMLANDYNQAYKLFELTNFASFGVLALFIICMLLSLFKKGSVK